MTYPYPGAGSIPEYPTVDTTPLGLAKLLLAIIERDRDRVEYIDRYVHGHHDGPYMPPGADEEYHLLAKRAVSNWIPLLINTPAQALYVDSFRRGTTAANGAAETDTSLLPEWKHWQASRLDARQLAVHRGALKYGHSFTVTEIDGDGIIRTRGLSAHCTAAVYEDPANDIDPYAALTVTNLPTAAIIAPNVIINYTMSTTTATKMTPGKALMWTKDSVYEVSFESYGKPEGITISEAQPHGLSECPVTRFAAEVDLEGRTWGVVETHIPVQDRINQTVFDLLVAQTYGSFNVRTITGMAPPMVRWTQPMIDGKVTLPPGWTVPEGVKPGDPVIDPESGRPIAEGVNLNARRFFFAEDEKVKFDSLDATPLGGYIQSLDMSIRHLAAMTQTPPHYLLGEIANLSAEALQAAETALLRKVEEFRKSFGESWERVFRIAAELAGDTASAGDYAGEVLWRDVEMRSLAATADGLVKLRQIGIPLLGLWNRVPQATRTEIAEWIRLREIEVAALHKREDELAAQGLLSEQIQTRKYEVGV